MSARIINQSWGVIYSTEKDSPLSKMYLTDYKGTIWVNHNHSVFSTGEVSHIEELITKIRNKQLFKIKQIEKFNDLKLVIIPKSTGVKVDGSFLTEETEIFSGKCQISIDSHNLSLVFEAFCDVSDDTQLKNIGNDFRYMSLLGKGGYGLVYKGLHVQSEEFCAIKINREIGHDDLKGESHLLRKLLHKNVIMERGFVQLGQDQYLITEYAEGGSLFHRIRSGSCFDEKAALNITGQIVSAVAYIHSKGIIHRDLKPENVVLMGRTDTAEESGNCVAKLIDFGLACYTHDSKEMDLIVGAPRYMSPEMIKRKVYRMREPCGAQMDVWGIGVCLFYALTRKEPFEYHPNLKVYLNRLEDGLIQRHLPGIINLSERTEMLLLKFLTVNPKNRPLIGFFVNFWISRTTDRFKTRYKTPSSLNLEKPKTVPVS